MKIGIIGGGFSGMMTALHLLDQAKEQIEVFIINEGESFIRGIAFNPYSKQHLLNVPASKMSAFPDQPDHFLDWVMKDEYYRELDRKLLANAFLPRHLFGNYLLQVWNSQPKKTDHASLTVVDDKVIEINKLTDNRIRTNLKSGKYLILDECVIATGNTVPANVRIKNPSFYASANYFQNPWELSSVQGCKPELPVMIIGTGLTMVDTVLGLRENGFNDTIISISRHGYHLLPHRNTGIPYTALAEEFPENYSLSDLVTLFNRHIKKVRKLGLSAEPVIDSIRYLSQSIWIKLSIEEKKTFLSRINYLWAIARHRIPTHIHDEIQKLRIEGKLETIAGKLIEFEEKPEGIEVSYFDHKLRTNQRILVSRVINCTGPQTDLSKSSNELLSSLHEQGVICQDDVRLGIKADPHTFQLINSNNKTEKNIYTIGSNLKGILFESTAVPELRTQAFVLAKTILKKN